jgi:hypothetical protein
MSLNQKSELVNDNFDQKSEHFNYTFDQVNLRWSDHQIILMF